MRIKRTSILCGIGVILTVMIIWHTVQREDMPNTLVRGDADLESLCFSGKLNSKSSACNFLSRVKSLEKEIGENKRVLQQMYDTMDSIMRLHLQGKTNWSNVLHQLEKLVGKLSVNEKKLENLDKDVPDLNIGGVGIAAGKPLVRRRLPQVRVPISLCPASHASTEASANIDMADLYETLEFDNPDGGVWKQGFPITVSDDMWKTQPLQVFVVPHSHQDPGWVKTYDEYFTQSTKIGFDNMLDFLTNHPKMRFIYAEITYFHRWYESLSDTKQEQVKKLLKNNQLEIVSGGWVMTDEANSHYYAALEEMTTGHQWLQDHLQYQPRVSWSIDPFGYSSTMPYLWRKMGFRYMLIQRVHYTIKKYLAKETQLEYVWRQRWDQNGTNDIFCHMMPFYSYDIPHTCGPEPAICCQFDFMRGQSNFGCPWGTNAIPITDDNVEQRALKLLDQYRKKSTLYRNKIVLVPLGDDFRYTTPLEWKLQYENYQKLFDYLNSRKDLHVEVKFSTLSDYFSALETRAGVANSLPNPLSPKLPQGYPALIGDMFTYADRDDHYWSGYFTSRPYHKRLDRYLEDKLRQAEILFSVAVVMSKKFSSTSFEIKRVHDKLEKSRRELSLFQHHDGITGTAKSYVVNDYESKLLSALQNAHEALQFSLSFLSTGNVKDQMGGTPESKKILLVDLSDNTRDFMKQKPIMLNLKDGDSLMLYVFNSLGQARSGLVTIWVNDFRGVSLLSSGNQLIPFDVFPYLYGNAEKSDGYLLHFLIADMSPLSLELVTLNVKSSWKESHQGSIRTQMSFYNMDKEVMNTLFSDFHPNQGSGKEFVVENGYYRLTFDASNGLLQSVTNKETEEKSKLQVSFMIYGARSSQERSGAYLFIPDGQPKPDPTSSPKIRILKGEIVSEVIVNLDHVEHHVRLINTPGPEAVAIDIFNYVDLTNSRGNEELIMQIESDVQNKDRYFYTDLNCFQFLRRRTYDKLPIQGNVYPMPCGAYMEDDVSNVASSKHRRLTLLASQSQGVAAPNVGVFQIWMDRRLLQDDNRGLGEGVIDNRPWTPNKLRILLEDLSLPPRTSSNAKPMKQGHLSATATANLRSLLHSMQTWHVTASTESIQKQLLKNINLLTGKGLPCDYHLVNLRTKLSSTDSSTSAILTLHRQAVSCGTSWMLGTNCEFTDKGGISYRTLFNDLIVSKISHVSLSQIMKLQEVSDKTISVSPMELDAFQLEFE